MSDLVSPGISVKVVDKTNTLTPTQTAIPLIVIATRSNKVSLDGIGIASGTAESGVLRLLGGQRELLETYGSPVFVTSNGEPVHGDETNEYGLLAAYDFLGIGNGAYVIRADIDLAQLQPKTQEPVSPPADNTYWIEQDAVAGGIFVYDGTNWNAQPFAVYTVSPTSADGNNGDFAFDMSTSDNTLMTKQGGSWVAVSSANGFNLTASPTAPSGAAAGDVWYKTATSANGRDWKLSRYRAVDNNWVYVPVVAAAIPPVPNEGTVWEDISNMAADGSHPIYVGTGSVFVPLTMIVAEQAPTTDPADGTYWFDNTMTDFAMYMEGTDAGRGDQWVPIVTTTVSNPSNTQKVISASAPTMPQEGAIWIDISTPENIDNFPVVKKMIGGTWIDITSDVIIQDTDPGASAVANGTYWINTGEVQTTNIVKVHDADYTAVAVQLDNSNQYVVVPQTGNHWKPASEKFGRRGVRDVVVKALQEAVAGNSEIRSEVVNFHLIAAPGYPELADEMNTLNLDRDETAFVVIDPPKFMSVNATATGREIGVQEWLTNARGADVTGEDGFASARSPHAGMYYPWCIGTNVDGNDVFMPPSFMALRTIAYNDTVSYPWFPPAGVARGRVANASSVGVLNNAGEYETVSLTKADNDLLYVNGINPITFFPAQGLVINGQKTMYGNNTALNRINVARLVERIKSDLRVMLRPFLFEINDSNTRASVDAVVSRYMTGIMAKNGVYDFAVQCDEENNPPSVIDANELVVDLAIKPSKAIEFIHVNISLVNTGDPLL